MYDENYVLTVKFVESDWLAHFIIEPSNTDNSEWSSNYSFGDAPKPMPEDDLGMFKFILINLALWYSFEDIE